MYLLLRDHLLARQASNDPGGGSKDGGTTPEQDAPHSSGKGGMSPVGIFFLIIFILLLIGFAGYVVHTHLRARRLGLPTPTLTSYIPFTNNSSNYRSQRSAAQFGALPGHDADDEAWDSRGYGGWDDATEMRPGPHGQAHQHASRDVTTHTPSSGSAYDGVSDPVGGGGGGAGGKAGRNPHRSMEFGYSGYTGGQEEERGRSQWRPESGDTFTGVSVKGGRPSLEVSGGVGYENGGRRSVFRESM